MRVNRLKLGIFAAAIAALPIMMSSAQAQDKPRQKPPVSDAEIRYQAGGSPLAQSEFEQATAAKMQAFERAQGAVTLSLQRLQEAYPELKSQGNYTTLMSQLEGTENRITIARTDYNNAVQAYNTKIRTFPDAVGAKIFYGAKPLTPFAATTPGADQAPTVNFGNAS